MRNILVATLIALVSAGCGDGGAGIGPEANPAPGEGLGPGGLIPCPAGTVCMTSGTFDPPSVTISRNGSVTFTNESGALHNVLFTSGKPEGGDIPLHTSGSRSRKFSSAGAFGFYCSQHGSPTSGMRGAVIVR